MLNRPLPPSLLGTDKWESEMRVGLRSAYICTVLATKMMVTQRSGLIVNISSVGGMRQSGPLLLVQILCSHWWNLTTYYGGTKVYVIAT